MPTYSYRCTECGNEFDVHQSFSDDPLKVCEACGGRLRKLFNSVGIVFKGSGFYHNDARSSSGALHSKNPEGHETSDSSGAGSGDGAGTERHDGGSGSSDHSGSSGEPGAGGRRKENAGTSPSGRRPGGAGSGSHNEGSSGSKNPDPSSSQGAGPSSSHGAGSPASRGANMRGSGSRSAKSGGSGAGRAPKKIGSSA